MSFKIFADGSANLPKDMSEDITILPCEYTLNGEKQVYTGDIDGFDAHAFYESLRSGSKVKTSLLNTDLFKESFEPVLEAGEDVIYISMSSGISGTFNAARLAAVELMEKFKSRLVHIVDSLGCGFGNGLLAFRAAKLSKEGVSAGNAAVILDEEVPHTCQYFTVDDLNFLRSTGRVSGVSATIGTMLNIKPILYGNRGGKIVACNKTIGRKKSIEALAKKYEEKHIDQLDQPVCISHGDCPEDANRLAALISKITPDVNIRICKHEPFSGSHVGPGMLGLFFRGAER